MTFIPILLNTACVITSRHNQGAAAEVYAIGEQQLKRVKLLNPLPDELFFVEVTFSLYMN